MKKSYELKNATFTCDVAEPDDVRAMGDAEINALVRNAYSSWAFRRGARKESDGKHYTVQQVVADMLATGERGGGITEADTKLADRLFFEAGGLARNASEADKEAVLLRAIAKYREHAPDFSFDVDDDLAAHDNAAAFLAERRRDIARRSKTSLL